MSSTVFTDYVAALATEIDKASSVALQPAAAQQPAITLNRDNYNANKALMPGSLIRLKSGELLVVPLQHATILPSDASNPPRINRAKTHHLSSGGRTAIADIDQIEFIARGARARDGGTVYSC